MAKTKIGIIGVGGIAQGAHIPAFAKHEDVEILAVCDTREDVLNKVADEVGAKYRFTDYNDLLKIDEIDAVDVCTPNFMHVEPTVSALMSGKHVIVEKPIALNAEEGRAMVEASKKSGKQLMVAYCWRWNPGARALKRFVEAGDMGDIYYAKVQAMRRRGIPGWGVFTQKDKQGGGPLIDIGCHLLDLTLWLMGHPKPVSVSGLTYAKFGHRSDILGLMGQWDYKNFTVEDFAVGLIRFENGASLTIESSFAANIEKNILNSSLMGTEGGCQLDPLKIFREENKTLIDLTPTFLPTVKWHDEEIVEFIDAIRNNTPVPVPGEEGLMVTSIIDAIYKSAEEGKEVSLV
ncbi:MAG: Gfo/Idh/MocA family oxidoreductase [Armatimonadota bacterium]|nr:gfo/Idh/MocA family oxidoreductase [Armatimonadota bacterium]